MMRQMSTQGAWPGRLLLSACFVLLTALGYCGVGAYAEGTTGDKKPDPELVLTTGELRLEGRVTAITGAGTFTMQAIAFITPSGNKKEFDEPKAKQVTAPDGAIVRGPDAPRRYKFSDMKLGEPVAVIGKGITGGVLKARVVVLLDAVHTNTVREVVVSQPVALLARAGMDAFRAGQTDRAVILLRQAASVAASSGDRPGEASSDSNLGLVLNASKKPQEALKVLARALQVSRDLDDAGGQSIEFMHMAQSQFQLGDRAEAVGDLEKSLTAARAANNTKILLYPLAELAEALDNKTATPEELARAVTLYGEAIPLLREERATAQEGELTVQLALLKIRLGDPDAARDLIAKVEALLPGVTDNAQRAGVLESLGIIYGLKSFNDEAKSHDYLTKAGEAYGAAGDPAGVARVQQRLNGPAKGEDAPDAPNAAPNPAPAANGDQGGDKGNDGD